MNPSPVFKFPTPPFHFFLHPATFSPPMAASFEIEDEADYGFIDIEINSSLLHSTLLNKQFEFHTTSSSSTSSSSSAVPADDLFYKGKLLPLHTCLQTVVSATACEDEDGDFFTTPPTATTPFDSCVTSPTHGVEMQRIVVAEFPRKKWWWGKMVVRKVKETKLWSFFRRNGRREGGGKEDKEEEIHRGSFSFQTKRNSGWGGGVSSSTGSYSPPLLSSSTKVVGRSSSVNSELDCWIKGTVSHCKHSTSHPPFFCIRRSTLG